MNIKELKLEEIKPYPNNPRVNDHAVSAVKNSIRMAGYKQPIVVDKDYVIVVGHTRYKALAQIEAEDGVVNTYPIIVADDLDEKQINAYRITDNKVGELAEWSFPELSYEVSVLADDYDFTDFGFSQKEVDLLLGEVVLDQSKKDFIKIQIGKDSCKVDPAEFEAWSIDFYSSHKKSPFDFLLYDCGLGRLRKNYELSR